jgi:hypothetical protein
MYRLRTIGLAAVLTIIVAACSSSASSSPTVAPTVSTAPTLGATPSAAATGSESAIPSIDLPNSAPELLALLPDKVGDVASFPQAQVSMNGKDFIAQGGDQGNQEFVDFLQRLGASADDVTVASKTYADLANASGEATAIFAFRVAGADSGQLLCEMQTAVGQAQQNVDWQSGNVGGKSVQVASTDQVANGKTYLYVKGDIVFAVIASDEALAADALSHLP